MGQEIERFTFAADDFGRFRQRVAAETELLAGWLREGRCDAASYVGGFELEAWLLDHNFYPAPRNQEFLATLNHPLVVPELSRFNIELNGTPQPLAGQALRRIEVELRDTWRRCEQAAHELECQAAMIGILPTIRPQDLTLANISPLNRYYALNEQIVKLRQGRPLRLNIKGREWLRLDHDDVMFEAATTSFQVHLQAPAAEAGRYFNAAQVLAAPMVALSANSPYLFQHDLWDETRVPLFEQAVDVGGGAGHGRVTFGSGYLDEDVLAYFNENLQQFPVLLPILSDDDAAQLRHLRLHNGTIWRWNRLLVGTAEAGRAPHLRVEHRVMPAGPSLIDMVANAAVYLGASRFLAGLARPPEADLPFATARDNFYAAARDGAQAQLRWLDGQVVAARDLLLDEILPMAREGLRLLGADDDDAELYLDIAATRVRSGQTGAAWQRAHVARYGHDFYRLTADYLEQQRSGSPVHEWPL